ncbi:MAG: LCP family protein [Tumebacillaceae bacterium]
MAYQGKHYQNQVKRTTYQPVVTQKQGGGGGPRPPKRPKKPRKRIKWGRLLLVLVLFTFVMTMTGLAGYGWYLQRKVVDTSAASAAPLDKSQPVNVLLVGLDRDPHGDAARQRVMNTDTLIIAHIDPANHQAYLLSIPRDSRVQLPTGWDKINAAYANGGMDELKTTVKNLTGLSLDRYLMIDFPAFVQAVDAIGGVEFDVDKQITDPEHSVTVNPGKQVLNGRQALAVVRFRHEELGDIGRVKRQQRFLAALGDKLKSSSLIDWMKGLRAVSDSLQTDMTISEMGMLTTAMQGKDTKITTNTVPGDFLDLYGVSYWKVDADQLHALVAGMDSGK